MRTPIIRPTCYAQAQLRKGMQVAFIGLALLIGLGFIGYRGDGTFYRVRGCSAA